MKHKSAKKPDQTRLDYLVAKPNEVQVISISQARKNKERRAKELDDFLRQSSG